MVRTWSTAIALVLLINIYTSLQFPATTEVNRNVTKFRRKIATQPFGQHLDNELSTKEINGDAIVSRNFYAPEQRRIKRNLQQTTISVNNYQDIQSSTTASNINISSIVENEMSNIRKTDNETDLNPEKGNSASESIEGSISGTLVKLDTSTNNAQDSNSTSDNKLSSAKITSSTGDSSSAITDITKNDSILEIRSIKTNTGNSGITQGTTVVSTNTDAKVSTLISVSETTTDANFQSNETLPRFSDVIDNDTMNETSVSTSDGKENNSKTENAHYNATEPETANNKDNRSVITLTTGAPGNDTTLEFLPTTTTSNTNGTRDENNISVNTTTDANFQSNETLPRFSDVIDNDTMNETSVSTSDGKENNSKTENAHYNATEPETANNKDNRSVITLTTGAPGNDTTLEFLPTTTTSNTNGTRDENNISVNTTTDANFQSNETKPRSSDEIDNDNGTLNETSVSTNDGKMNNRTLEKALYSAKETETSNTEGNRSDTAQNTDIPERVSTMVSQPKTRVTRTTSNTEYTGAERNVSVSTTNDANFPNNETATRNSNVTDNYIGTVTELSVSMNGEKNSTSASTAIAKVNEIFDNTSTTFVTGSTSDSNLTRNQYDDDNLTTGESLTNTHQSDASIQPQYSTQSFTNEESFSSTVTADVETSNSDDESTEMPRTPNFENNADHSLDSDTEPSEISEQNISNTESVTDTTTTTEIAVANTESSTKTSLIIPSTSESTTSTYKELITTTVTDLTTQWSKEINCSSHQGNVTITNFESNSTYFKIYFETNFNPYCIDEYVVKYQEYNKTELVQNIGTNKTFEISGLAPCTKYGVRVETAVLDKMFPSNIINITTENHAPGKIENLEHSLGSHKLHAHWDPPTTAPNCVEGYSIALTPSGNINRPQIMENVTIPEFIIRDLHSCTNYTLKIRTLGVGSYANETEINLRQTDSEAPPAPASFTDVTIGSRWIEGAWILPKLENTKYGCGLSSLIMTCQQIDIGVEISRRSEVNLTTNQVYLKLPNLEPNRPYTCFSTLNNSFGLHSQPSPSYYFHTNEEVPDAPQKLEITEVTSKNITVKWEPPMSKKANITSYKVKIVCETDPVRPSCDSSSMRCPESIREFPVKDTQLTIAATPNTQYSITVAAIAKVGEGVFFNPTISNTTLPTVAKPVVNLKVNMLPSKNDSDSASIDASWESPCLTSGTLDYYQVALNGERVQHSQHRIMENTSDTKITIPNLKYEFNYTLKIQTHYSDVESMGLPETSHFQTEATIPASKETPENKMQVLANENIDPSYQALVLIKRSLFTEDTGRIMKWSLVVSNKNVTKAFGKLPAPTLESWSQTKAGENDMYQATVEDWMPFEMKEVQYVIFTLGKDHNCRPESKEFCNGPLNPDSEYTVMLRAQTAAGYRDLSKTRFKTAPNYKLTIILVCVFVFILVVVVSFVLINMRRRQHGWPRKLMVTLFGMTEETPTPRQCKPIPLEKFGAHYETVTEVGASGESRLAEEFRLLATLSPANVVTNPAAYSTALAPDNKFKNRYVNILPYDDTRVKISVVDNDPSSNYINASLIKGYSGEVEYIASQGPKLETCEDFWRMIFEHDVTVIVMVTNLTEKGKDKCHQYYPNLRETKDFCFISVKCTTEINFPVYTSRTLLVQKESLQKTVVQLHFREWPDFGCPVSTDLMLSFCQTVRHQYSRNEGLILVHCSAGVGRTGTLIAVDILLQHMREHKKLDVFGTVLKMRQQRINMVQTEGQYAYIYQCMKDALEDPSLLDPESSPNNSLDPIYANVSVARAEATCDSIATSPSLEGSEPEHKKFISPELVTLASECSEDFPPPPDDLEDDEVEYENFPAPQEDPVYENFPAPVSDDKPEYKNFPIEDEPEYGNYVGSLIDIPLESKKTHSSSAEMNSYPTIVTEDSDKETVL